VTKLSASVFAQTQAGAGPQAPIGGGGSWYVFKLKARGRGDPSKLGANGRKWGRGRLIGRKPGEADARGNGGLREKGKIVENALGRSYDVGPPHEAFSPDDF